MQRFLITMLVCFSVSYSQIKINHANLDTVSVSFDPLRLGLQYGDRNQFSYYWSNRYIHRDSVVWTINGNSPDPADVIVCGGATSKDLSPDFSNGTILILTRDATLSKYSHGVHSVEVAVHFPESTVTNTWKFRYFETMYKVIRAQTVIDTSYNIFTTYWTNCTEYKLLNIQQADTSVFGRALGLQIPDSLKSFLSFDTNGVIREYSAKKGSAGTIIPRDTIDGMIIQIQRGVEKYDEWYGPVAIESFLQQNEPPFQVLDALHTLTDYAKEKGMEIRSGTVNSELKLGPVFRLGKGGDPGWSLTALHDSSAWYFTYRLGYGDCPMGCTEWTTLKFRVFKDGTVINLNTGINSQLERVYLHTSASNTHSCYYNLQGQRSDFRDLKSKTIMSGVYILSGNVTPSKNQAVKIKLR